MNALKQSFVILCCVGWLGLGSPVLAQVTENQDRTWTVNIRNADIQAFIGQVADMTGRNFVVDPRVRARDVTVISTKQLSTDEVYELFLSVLQVHGYAAVPSGEVIKIVPNTTAKQSNLPLSEGNVAGEELITRVIAVDNSPVEELVPVLRPLVPQYGHLAAVSSANALIISDHADNIRRMESIIAHLDGAEAEEVEIIPMRHAWVGDVIRLLETMTPQAATVQPGGQNAQRRANSRDGRLSLIADERTNRLIVKGDSVNRRRIADLVRDLDVPASRSGSAKVIRLSHADAESLAELLKNYTDSTNSVRSGTDGAGTPRAAGANALALAGTNPGLRVSIQADTSLNALVIRAEPAMMEELESIVRQLDIRRSQILIEAAIVEISGSNGMDLAVQWAMGNGRSGLGGTNFNDAGLPLNSVLGYVLSGSTSATLPSGAIIGGGETDKNGDLRWGGMLTALATSSNVNLLSTPSILTLDNQEASIVVGQNVPFVTGSTTTTGSGTTNPFQTIQREDVGITLTVTPTLAGDGTVRLKLEQEASSVQESNAVDSADIITNKRSIKTTVLADDGQTIVLGGLIQDDVERTMSKVPLLGDIPLLGVLFRSSSQAVVKRNLIVFLRPTILPDSNRLVGLTRDRYLGITSMQFRMNRNGELERLVPQPLPTRPEQLFEGRSEVPQALRQYLDTGRSVEEMPMAESLLR